jgi:anti-anti-sigma regulatory factor
LTYRIRRSEVSKGMVFALSGEMDGEHAARLEDLIAEEGHGLILLDLQEVTVVARDAVRFLARAEARGIRIVNCPDYVRSWIAAEGAVRTGNSI